MRRKVLLVWKKLGLGFFGLEVMEVLGDGEEGRR